MTHVRTSYMGICPGAQFRKPRLVRPTVIRRCLMLSTCPRPAGPHRIARLAIERPLLPMLEAFKMTAPKQ